MSQAKCVMIIAGEASGDLHGANLVKAMRSKDPGLVFEGIGGPRLREAGVKVRVDASHLAVVGITEVLHKVPVIYRALITALRLLRRLRPALLILIDFPDFNMLAARAAKRLGVRVLYYVSPQIWAWRSGRVKTIKRLVDHMAVILPFEADFYRKHRVPVSFVGHPLLDQWASWNAGKDPSPPGSEKVIGLLPGSRQREVVQLLPVMLKASRLLRERLAPVRFVVSVAPTVPSKLVQDLIDQHGLPEACALARSEVYEVLQQCRMVIAASGTVGLEAAIAGVPMVIIYKVSPLTYRMGKALIRVQYISLVNLIAGRQLVPELIQDQVTADNIARTAMSIMTDADQVEELKREFQNVRAQLGGPGASQRVAGLAMRLIQ